MSLNEDVKLQPLRVPAGWLITYNTLYQVEPIPGNEDYFDGSSLLMLRNDRLRKLIDVSWRPERDLKGQYQVEVLNFIEHFNPRTNEIEMDADWEFPYQQFSKPSLLGLVERLEQLMMQLPNFVDPRILKSRGVVDEPSEQFRKDLEKAGPTEEIVSAIIIQGNAIIQSMLIDHKNVDKKTVRQLSEKGITKGVRNKAKQKLKSKAFRE